MAIDTDTRRFPPIFQNVLSTDVPEPARRLALPPPDRAFSPQIEVRLHHAVDRWRLGSASTGGPAASALLEARDGSSDHASDDC
jgi:hypothetical protein